jgi:hypothetical protein
MSDAAIFGEFTEAMVGPRIREFCAQIDEKIPFIDEDMPLDRAIAELCSAIETRAFMLADAP